MKLNWAERLVVNNPLRAFEQGIMIRKLKDMMPLERGLSVLEVGCGRGAGARLILREFEPLVLHALDLDIKMVGKVKTYLNPEERAKVPLYVGDVSQLPFKNESVDAVFGFGVLHHAPDWRRAVLEIARVLKTGGAFFIEEIYPPVYLNIIARNILAHPLHDRFFSPDLGRSLEEAGLPVKKALEIKKLGILGVSVKEP
jgi:ubiquinone/menaquinone biosynthesis C-methylase UbiE